VNIAIMSSKRAGQWTRMERILFLAVSGTIGVLAYAYCFHMYRSIVFDEIGLHNPIYMYVATGKITYPMHGQPDFMTVHPPPHYILTALLVKAGLPVLKASAAPVFALTMLIPVLLYTGGFSFSSAVAFLLAVFLATFVWGEFYTIRPDLMVTYLWVAGLLALQGAKNHKWSPWRLFIGTALTVSAACMHYWGIAALAGVVVYGYALIRERRWQLSTTAKPLAAIAAGGLAIGLPFLMLFVIPRFPDILEMVGGVQGRVGGPGGPIQAFQRHIKSYADLAPRVELDSWVRWLTSLLTAPLLYLRIPAALVGVPLLALWHEMRTLAVAAAPLPLFVLFYSQSKQIGYTGYLMPEMIIYFAAVLLVLINVPAFLFYESARPMARIAAAILVCALTVVQVPTSMGARFDWTPGLDLLEVSRGAAVTIVGRDGVVGNVSAGTWYTGGGQYVWNAFDDLVAANEKKFAIGDYLKPIDALVVDGNWWNEAPDLAPVSSWYLQHLLYLKGFVLPNTPATKENFLLFFAAKREPAMGYFIDKEKVVKFTQVANGEATFALLSCPETIDLSSLSTPFYKMSFAYMSEPQETAPQIVVLGVMGDDDLPDRIASQSDCTVRDAIRGSLTDAPRNELRKLGSAAIRPPMSFYQDRDEALRAAGRRNNP
jgi:hypothetical protein